MTKEQRRVYDKVYHKTRSKESLDRKFALQRKRIKEIRLWLTNYKTTNGCSQCSENDWRCLDFHHNKGSKSFNIGDAGRAGKSIETIQSEIAKCIILCANCHRKETFDL